MVALGPTASATACLIAVAASLDDSGGLIDRELTPMLVFLQVRVLVSANFRSSRR